MATDMVRINRVRDQQFLMRDCLCFPMVMAQPSGANAADLLLFSVTGCSIWDIVAVLQKQQHITDVQVTAESVREDEPPWRFRKIHIHYTFTGRSLKEHSIQRAIGLTETKYCSTYATLREGVELTSEYEIRSVEEQQNSS